MQDYIGKQTVSIACFYTIPLKIKTRQKRRPRKSCRKVFKKDYKQIEFNRRMISEQSTIVKVLKL